MQLSFNLVMQFKQYIAHETIVYLKNKNISSEKFEKYIVIEDIFTPNLEILKQKTFKKKIGVKKAKNNVKN